MTRLEAALRAARDTKHLELGRGVVGEAGRVFREQFGDREPSSFLDENTFGATGPQLLPQLGGAARVLEGEIPAAWEIVEKLENELRGGAQIPVAVGAGTINDVVKLVAHRLRRPYMCVATAASMDGYTAYGASITRDGSKQTFDCPAPRAVIADLDIIEAAPPNLTGAGYADLLAKITAGADWIIADAAGIEPIDPHAWETVQGGLREALAHPIDIERLTQGLLVSGFAMQSYRSSRPASGAEHQFSHLWDMQHHTHEGEAPSHGFKVGVATIAVARFYENLMALPADALHPTADADPDEMEQLFDDRLLELARRETAAKANPPDLVPRLREIWPQLVQRLREQLPSADELASMLDGAGAPTQPEQIGISPVELRESFRLAYHIRRRFTVLDLAVRAGVWEDCLP